jgi:hypothetical protein
MGYQEGKLRVRAAGGGRAEKIQLYAGDKKVQDIGLQRTSEFQVVDLDAAFKEAPAIRVVVEGGAANVAISELEVR